jgi:hypothetical protein
MKPQVYLARLISQQGLQIVEKPDFVEGKQIFQHVRFCLVYILWNMLYP